MYQKFKFFSEGDVAYLIAPHTSQQAQCFTKELSPNQPGESISPFMLSKNIDGICWVT